MKSKKIKETYQDKSKKWVLLQVVIYIITTNY